MTDIKSTELRVNETIITYYHICIFFFFFFLPLFTIYYQLSLPLISDFYEKTIPHFIADSPIFFNLYFAAPQATWGHYQGDNLIHPMLINVLLQFRPKGHQEPYNKAELGFSA